MLINGLANPAPVELHVGVAYRLRVVNITSARPGMRVDLWRDSTVLDWRLLARDGADLPDADRMIRPARQAVSIGQTADVEITPKSPGELRFEVRANSGVTLGTLLLHVVQ